MDRRHFPNSFTGKMDRGHHRNRAMANQSYIQTGGLAVPESGPLVDHMNNALMGGYHRTTHWTSETNEYPSSSSMQAPHHPRPFSGPYNEPSGAGNAYVTPQLNPVISHPSDYDRYIVNRNMHGPQDSVTRSRGTLKRKGPETSGPYEMGSSSSRYYGAGGSSRSSELSRRRPSSNVYYGHGEGPYCGNGSSGEDLSRNVRRRPTLVSEDNQMSNHESSYSSRYHYLPNNPPNYYGEASVGNMNNRGTNQNWNSGTMPHAAHGRVQTAGANGLSHVNNHLVARGSGPEPRDYHSECLSGRDVIGQSARGRRSSHPMRDIPPYNAGLSYYSMRHEPTSTEERLQTHSVSSYRHSSQSARGWCNSYSGGTSGIAVAGVQRFHSTASSVEYHDRIESEGQMMDLAAFYDQYRDMRLDIDDMSYEELLALGESIGNVNTGLPDDVITLSLTEKAFPFVGNSIEETCVICLEDYRNEVKIGTVKNCGHNYHADCIKKWLSMKNVCPICKAPAHKDCLNQE